MIVGDIKRKVVWANEKEKRVVWLEITSTKFG